MKKIMFILICVFSVSVLFASINNYNFDSSVNQDGTFQVIEDVAVVDVESYILKNTYEGDSVFIKNVLTPSISLNAITAFRPGKIIISKINYNFPSSNIRKSSLLLSLRGGFALSYSS